MSQLSMRSPVLREPTGAAKGTARPRIARNPRRPVASSVPREPRDESKRCTHHTRAGQPCRAWAVRGTDPPACSVHAGRAKGGGAPKGNQNARKHGFYSRTLSADELADLLDDPDLNLDAEIVCARVALRRVLQYLSTDLDQLSAADQVRALALVFHGARTVARLLRDLHALGGDVDPFDKVSGQVLDEKGKELGIPL